MTLCETRRLQLQKNVTGLPPHVLHQAQTHTTWDGPTRVLTLCPTDFEDEMSTRDILGQFSHVVLSNCCDEPFIHVMVDVRELDSSNGSRLVRTRGLQGARQGISLFNCLPCSVRSITVLQPRRHVWWWHTAVTVVRTLMSTKMTQRLQLC